MLELEQVREALLEEKQELKEIISSLKLQIMNLERDASLFHSSMESRAVRYSIFFGVFVCEFYN